MALALFAGCGNTTTTTDGGMDQGVADLMVPPPDLAQGMITTGNKIVTGVANLGGVTDDGFVLFAKAMGGSQAIPLAGGTPQVIDPKGTFAFANGNIAFSIGSYITSSRSATLFSWTSAGGAAKMITAGMALVDPAVLKNGTRMIYSTGTTADGKLTNYVVANVDGTVPATALTGTVAPADVPDGQTDPCQPRVRAGGTRFFVAYCNGTAMDAGVQPSTLSAVDATTGVATTVLANMKDPGSWSVDDAGTKVLAFDITDKANVYPVPAGVNTMIEGGAAIKDGVITPDGTAVLYLVGTTFKRVTLLGGATITLASNVDALRALSDDYGLAFYRTKVGMAADQQPVGDILLVPTAQMATPITFESAAIGTFFGPAVTTDKQFALFDTDVDATSNGTFKSAPIAGGTARTLAPVVWNHDVAAGSKVTYLDNYKAGNKRGNLNVVDVSGTGAPTLIATQIEETYAFSKSRTKVVYEYRAVKGMEGIFVADVP